MRILCSLLVFILLQSCSSDNVKKDDSLKKYFDEYNATGCFGLLDNGTGKFTIYNLDRFRDSAYQPASTFKIVNSIIGLQTGKIVDDSMIIRVDTANGPFHQGVRNLSMYQAFRDSYVPYYQEVARRIGKDTMQRWLDAFGYGKKSDTDKVVINSSIDNFWRDNSITVTPDQQMGLLKKVYFNELPGVFKRSHEIVKKAMIFENNTQYQLSYKTGRSGWDEKKQSELSWVIGWIVENNHPYFFVLNFETQDRNADVPVIRIEMLKKILKDLGFLSGKM